MAVPDSIFSVTSKGTNNLLKASATPATGYIVVLDLLGIEAAVPDDEQAVLDLLMSGSRDREVLLAESKLEVTLFNQTLTMLEITGKIRSLGAGQWSFG